MFYKNETNFTFKKCVTKLKVIFNVLGNYGVPLYEKKKVDNLLDHITYQNTSFKTEVNIYRYSHYSTFVKVYIYLSSVVGRLYPTNNPSSVLFRKRGIYASVHGD